MRMLGAVTGLSVSTAVQHAVASAALAKDGGVGGFSTPDPDAEAEAKMQGIRAVFIIMVPLIALCGVACFVIPNVVLEGDERRQVAAREDAYHRQ